MLDEAKVDAIEVSGATSASGEKVPVRTEVDQPDKEGYNLAPAAEIRKSVHCPVMAVGGFRSLDVINRALAEDGIDYISMSRPFIREPNLIKRWCWGRQVSGTLHLL